MDISYNNENSKNLNGNVLKLCTHLFFLCVSQATCPESDSLSTTTISTGSYVTTDPEQISGRKFLL